MGGRSVKHEGDRVSNPPPLPPLLPALLAGVPPGRTPTAHSAAVLQVPPRETLPETIEKRFV
jgi:hypothetical protein